MATTQTTLELKLGVPLQARAGIDWDTNENLGLSKEYLEKKPVLTLGYERLQNQ